MKSILPILIIFNLAVHSVLGQMPSIPAMPPGGFKPSGPGRTLPSSLSTPGATGTPPSSAPSTPLIPNPTTSANLNVQQNVVGPIILVDESVAQVLAILEKLTGKIILKKQNLPAVKINFNSQKPLTKEEAIDALMSVLTLSGIAVTPIGDKLLKAVPTTGVNAEAPEIISQPVNDLPASEKIVTKIFKIEYLPVKETMPTLQPLLSKNTGSIIPFYSTNSILVTDSVVNLQRMERLLQRLDQPIQLREDVHFYKLKNISATDLQAKLNKLKEAGLSQYFTGSTFFEADERTNQLMVVTHANNRAVIDKLIMSLDVDVEPATRSEVFYLKHAESIKVAEVIQKIIDGQRQAAKEKDKNRIDLAARDSKSKDIKSTSTEGGSETPQFSLLTTIVPDERCNAIVAYGMPGDIKQIITLIDKIDILLSQVAIEVVIAEVRLIDGQTRGLESLGLNYNLNPVDGTLANFTNNILQPGGNALSYNAQPGSPVISGGAQAFNLTSISTLHNFNLNVIFNTAKIKDNIKILSAPTILTTHNKKGIVNVADTLPFLSYQTSQKDKPDVTTNSIEYKEVGIRLEVTPLIGNNGIIQMDIKQTVKDEARTVNVGSAQNSVEVPIISTRDAESFVSVQSGEVVVLAGLQHVRSVKQKHKMFLLGELPYLGDSWFTRKTETQEIRELIFFLRPTFVAHPSDGASIAQKQIEQSYNVESLDQYFKTGRFKQEECAKPVSEECYKDHGICDLNPFFVDDPNVR